MFKFLVNKYYNVVNSMETYLAGPTSEYLGKGGALEYMSTVTFHFLICVRILSVVIERIPTSPLSQ